MDEWRAVAPEAMVVRLTWYEMSIAASVGVRRHIEALKSGRPDRYGAESGDGWGLHVEGAAGEMAVAKLLGCYWDGSVNTFHAGGDVQELQVRTRSRDDYELLVRNGDADDAIFVLVTGKAPCLTIRGGIMGADAKRLEWFHAHGGRPPAYFVPHRALAPVQTLWRQVKL